MILPYEIKVNFKAFGPHPFVASWPERDKEQWRLMASLVKQADMILQTRDGGFHLFNGTGTGPREKRHRVDCAGSNIRTWLVHAKSALGDVAGAPEYSDAIKHVVEYQLCVGRAIDVVIAAIRKHEGFE